MNSYVPVFVCVCVLYVLDMASRLHREEPRTHQA